VRHINGKTPAWIQDLRRLNGSARPEVERIFLRAIISLAALPDREARYFHVTTLWPLVPRDGWFAYEAGDVEDDAGRHTPSPRDLDELLPALEWGRQLDRQQWRICHDTAAGYSAAAIGDRLRIPTATVASRYSAALDTVVAAALVDRPQDGSQSRADEAPVQFFGAEAVGHRVGGKRARARPRRPKQTCP
jgi:hypothetical protein